MVLKKVPGLPADPASLADNLSPLTLPLSQPHIFPEDQFNVGDIVKISTDRERVSTLQTGHGEWVESMDVVGHMCRSCVLVSCVLVSCETGFYRFFACVYSCLSGP